MPIFFIAQFAFLYDGWKNEVKIDLKASVAFLLVGGLILFVIEGLAGTMGLAAASLGLDALIGADAITSSFVDVVSL